MCHWYFEEVLTVFSVELQHKPPFLLHVALALARVIISFLTHFFNCNTPHIYKYMVPSFEDPVCTCMFQHTSCTGYIANHNNDQI